MILVGYFLFGIALGLVYAPMSTAAMAAMPGEKVGIASGVLAMDRVLAGAMAPATTGAVFQALLGDGHSFADAVAGSTWVVAVLCGLGVGLTWAFVRDIEPPGPDPAVAGELTVEQLQRHRHHRCFHPRDGFRQIGGVRFARGEAKPGARLDKSYPDPSIQIVPHRIPERFLPS